MTTRRGASKTADWVARVGDERSTASWEGQPFDWTSLIGPVVHRPDEPTLESGYRILSAETHGMDPTREGHRVFIFNKTLDPRSRRTTSILGGVRDPLTEDISEALRRQLVDLLTRKSASLLGTAEGARLAGEHAWLDADAQVMPTLGEPVTPADQGLVSLVTSYNRESVALRVPFEDE